MIHQTKKCVPNYLSLAYVCTSITFNTKRQAGDFPAGPAPFNAAGVGSIPAQGAKTPHASWPKKPTHKTRSNTVKNSVKTLTIVHIKKKKDNHRTFRISKKKLSLLITS